VRHNGPDCAAGYILGYATSAQYIGQVTGPLTGGFIAAHSGMHSVFVMTSVLMFAGAAFNACLFMRENHAP
jgi:MFS family permease